MKISATLAKVSGRSTDLGGDSAVNGAPGLLDRTGSDVHSMESRLAKLHWAMWSYRRRGSHPRCRKMLLAALAVVLSLPSSRTGRNCWLLVHGQIVASAHPEIGSITSSYSCADSDETTAVDRGDQYTVNRRMETDYENRPTRYFACYLRGERTTC